MVRRTRRARGARRQARLASALVVAVTLAVTAVGCDPTDLNTRLGDYGDSATAGKLNSGAGGASVLLADGRVVFLANDVYTGTVSGGIRANNTRVDNALLVAASLDPGAALTTKLGSGGTAYLKPSNPANHYRLLGAVAGASDIQVFAAELTSSDVHVATKIIRLLQSDLSPVSTVTAPYQANGPEWGSHVLKHTKDNRWYIYGNAPNGATYVARAPTGNLTIPGNWEFWTGSTWSDSHTDARALRDWSGQIVWQHLTPAYHADAGRFVFLGRTAGASTAGNTFTFSTATTPWGPLTGGGTAATVPAESCGSGGSVYGFDIVSHPHLSDDQANAVFSYSRRCTVPNTAGVAAIDRPRFFEVDLADAPTTPRWRASWAEGLGLPAPNNPVVDWDYPNGFGAGTSLRQIVHSTRGSSTVRIRLSNHWGTVPLQIGAASVAISTQAAGTTKAVTGTPDVVTFGGQTSVTIPVGQTVHSDAITLSNPVPSDHDVAITLYFPAATGRPGVHPAHLETSHVGSGNQTASVSGSGFNVTTDDGYFLTGLDVVDSGSGGTVAAFGDSLTNGWGSAQDAEMRWTDRLYDKLVTGGTPVRTVVNLGVSGNQLLPGVTSPNSGLERFERDVLSSPAVTSVVLWIGFNDISAGRSAADVAEGLETLVDTIRGSGRKVILGTISPLVGPADATIDLNKEYQRLLLNAMIRNGELGANGYADIDAAVRDSSTTWKVRAAYALAGGSHFNHDGNNAIADAVYAKRSLF